MKEKTRRILIMIVMAALIVSLMAASFAALTYGRYSGGRRDENSPYEDYIDFVGATAYEVRTPEQFVNAINNGYSYIKIAADAEEPFVVNNDIANVYTNLVIDVNGKTVIRNSRNPVLDVRRSISVVLVYDSSVEGSGGFYNPVGSALQTSGGSLTVGAGVYESGPRTDPDSSVSGNVPATVYSREVRTGKEYTLDESTAQLPKLTKDVYLDETYSGTKNDYLKPDTYLIYTEEKNAFVGKAGDTVGGTVLQNGQLYVNRKETSSGGTTTITADKFSPICDVASCDFYYYYPVGTAGTANSPQTYAVVYGYNDVKGLAKTEDADLTEYQGGTQLVWPYAAIRSVEDGEVGGVTHARGGTFTTNFGTDNTYGIYSVGGTMTVGTDSASTPPKFTATGEGTCIGMSAGENDTLTIENGEFSSKIGDTILMRGGEMTVTGGTFTKSGNKARPSGGLEDIEASRTALIHMLGGELTIDGTVTRESDSTTYSVNMTAGSTDAPLTNVFGIYSAEDDTSGRATAGTVSVSGCSIAVHGTYSAGILSSAGTVNVGGTENGKAETNITVNNSISNNLLTSSAVSSEGGTINLNNTVNITSDSLGITARGTINVGDETTQAAANVTVNTENATGVYVNNGTLNVNAGATLGVTSTVRSNTKWVQPPEGQTEIPPSIYNGVYVNGGSLNSTGILNVDFTGVVSDDVGDGDNETVVSGTAYRDFIVKSYAVRVESSNTTEDDGTQTDTVTIAAGDITNSIGGGVLVNGGVVTLGAVNENNVLLSAPTVSATAKEGEAEASDVYYTERSVVAATGVEADYNWRYAPPRLGGDAVKVVNGELTIYGGSYSARHGNGILVSNGEAEVEGGTFSGNDVRNDNKTSDYLTGAGSSFGFKLLGGTLTINGGTFSSGGGGAFVMEGTLNFVSGTVLAQGPTGISAWENATVYFGGTDEGASTDAVVEVHANSTGIAVETRTQNAPNITVYSGTFTGGINYPNYGITRPSTGSFDGIWYGNNAAVLKISGGTFQGYNRAGLFIAGNPGSNIQISGGTFEATNSGGAISGNSPGRITTGNIIASGSWCFDSEAVLAGNVTDETKRQHAICTYEFAWGTLDQYDYFQVGGGNSVNLTNNVSINGGDSRAFNTLGTIVVAIGDQITYRQ